MARKHNDDSRDIENLVSGHRFPLLHLLHLLHLAQRHGGYRGGLYLLEARDHYGNACVDYMIKRYPKAIETGATI